MTRALPLAIVAALALPLAGFASAESDQLVLQGACDGSAGVALDDEHFVSADDERNVLRIYRFDGGGEGQTAPLEAFLDTAVKNDGVGRKESDIEGAARIGDRIYWIGSHSRSKNGSIDPNRLRFFATDILPGPKLKAVGRAPYKNLLADMLDDRRLEKLNLTDAYRPQEKKNEDRAPECKDGFNIEGLAAVPNSPRLLIAFRNPVRDGAILVPFENPAEVIAGEGKTKAVFGAPIELRGLDGRGVRSIDYIGGRFLIIAGPYGDPGATDAPKPPFKLFGWSGDGADAATPLLLEIELVENEYGPEAIFESPKEKKLVLLYDEGDRKSDGVTECKKNSKNKSFTARKLPLPDPGGK